MAPHHEAPKVVSNRYVHELSWLWIISHFTRESWSTERTDKGVIEASAKGVEAVIN